MKANLLLLPVRTGRRGEEEAEAGVRGTLAGTARAEAEGGGDESWLKTTPNRLIAAKKCKHKFLLIK